MGQHSELQPRQHQQRRPFPVPHRRERQSLCADRWVHHCRLRPAASPAAGVADVHSSNAGGGASGTFAADTDASGGSTYSTSAAIDTSGVHFPCSATVYQTERYGSFTYTLPSLTPGASYTLRLHFAEVYWSAAGQRVFSVSVNGSPALTNFDIFAAAGGKNKAVVETVPVVADANGTVTVKFTTVKDNAKVSGLELTASSATVPPAPTGLTAAGSQRAGDFVLDRQRGGSQLQRLPQHHQRQRDPAQKRLDQHKLHGHWSD